MGAVHSENQENILCYQAGECVQEALELTGIYLLTLELQDQDYLMGTVANLGCRLINLWIDFNQTFTPQAAYPNQFTTYLPPLDQEQCMILNYNLLNKIIEKLQFQVLEDQHLDWLFAYFIAPPIPDATGVIDLHHPENNPRRKMISLFRLYDHEGWHKIYKDARKITLVIDNLLTPEASDDEFEVEI